MTENDSALAALRATGFALMAPLEHEQLERVQWHFKCCSVFVDAHVPQTARTRGEGRVLWASPRAMASECVCVLTDDVTEAPYLLERALGMTDIAAAYLGRDPPVLYSCNAFWTRPGAAPLRGDIQEFHRDQDDPAGFLAMFVYLSDVLKDEDGPHDLYGPDGICRTIYGPAGTVFLADTSRLHRGRKPTSRTRGFLWFRWGASDRPPANQWDRIEPIAAARLGARYPADPRLRESIRLLVQ